MILSSVFDLTIGTAPNSIINLIKIWAGVLLYLLASSKTKGLVNNSPLPKGDQASITIPLLRPTILFSFITSLIGGMQSFDIPYALSQGAGDPNNATTTMVMYLYRTAFVNNNYGYGAAVGYALFVIILVFAIISFKFINRNADDYE